jgi:hypothetical protein
MVTEPRFVVTEVFVTVGVAETSVVEVTVTLAVAVPVKVGVAVCVEEGVEV